MAKRTSKRKQSPSVAERLDGFELLDAAGRSTADPESVATLAWRYADGRIELFPFRWTICGHIGHAIGPGTPASRTLVAAAQPSAAPGGREAVG